MHLGIKICLLTLFIYTLCSCQKESTKSSSALIIAVEALSGSTFSCHPFEDSDRSGFQILCNEAIRFTHAYTPSPSSQAGLGALLTGVSPLLNGLRDNGLTYLQANIKTLPESLYNQHISTLFIASAPTIKRYSRLHQGFENFNDDYDFNIKSFYRPISDSVQIIKNWISLEVKNKPFFTIIHVADLLFPQAITQTEFLEPRPRGIEGQFEEIDENLFNLFSYLKKIKVWEKSYIILLGLNGQPSLSRENELPGINLYSENVSIPLFIKPPKGREEIPHQWKIDSHVSIQDVGATLFEIFNVKNTFTLIRSDKLLKGLSLLPSVKGKSDPQFLNRPILIESAWGNWHTNSFARYSIRNDQWFVLYDKKPTLYNTVSDRNELNKLSTKDSSYHSTLVRFEDYLKQIKLNRFESFKSNLVNEITFSQFVIDNEGQINKNSLIELTSQLNKINNDLASDTLQYLIVDQLLNHKNWIEIEFLNKSWKNLTLTQILSFKENLFNIKNTYIEPCLRLFQPQNEAEPYLGSQAHCENKNFILLSDFLKIKEEKNDILLEQLLPIIKNYEFQLRLIYFDFSKGGSIMGANSSKLKEIITYKLILNLPKYHKSLLQLEKKLNSHF